MRLYRDFTTQEQIDAEYNAGAAVPDSAARIQGWTSRSAVARQNLRCRLGVPFGPTREEYLDIFPAGDGAPVHVFIHGGYWRRFTAREHSFVAPALVFLSYWIAPRPLDLIFTPAEVLAVVLAVWINEQISGDGEWLLEVNVAPDDRGKVIGRQGRTIAALRALAAARPPEEGRSYEIELLD